MGNFVVTDRWIARTVLEKNNSSITKKWLADWAKEWENTRTEADKLLTIRRRELRSELQERRKAGED